MASIETQPLLATEPDAEAAAPTTSPPTESEPLLGRPGDALQKDDAPMINNLYLGTGAVAQAGGVLLLVVIWGCVFLHPTLPLVTPHPLLQSLGVFTLTQAILILQPTNTPTAKLLGARAHAALHLLSFMLFASGVAVIETNKHVNRGEHFHSLHGYLGAATGIVLLAQYLFGFFMWAVPAAFGGVDRAKATWRYHRYAGYVVLLLVLATVLSATDTDYNKGVLKIKTWSVALAVAMIVLGVFPRIQLSKLGIQRSR
ncbi:eukaryotic cytochrome b561-domain-containing protein [Podospora appendiculata]|uniref:Eukaryotic cytochrome b561-domain-containing protein n=1 Tax=Podospora appendiculata TaxID=314037 RepID=A0AAE0X347_9PEZI|nr:eukaryotic cytochrome b561-domain-containing protein [Podospora appendiculata]